MNKVWRVGLLGAGYILDSHAKALNVLPMARMAAVCDRSGERAQAAAQAYGIAQVFSSLDDLLRADVDVIHILLPPDSHVDAARQCIEAGKHVFLEKPMGLDAAACQSLVDLAAVHGVKLAVNHNFLFMPAYEKLRQQAADGTLGPLDQITINWLYPLGLIQSGPFNNWMLQEPKNLLFELGPHLLAFMVDLVGPLEQMQVDAFKPIDLPGGGRVYRRWHVHGRRGDTAVDLNLSVIPGFTDRSVFVRGHAATATCYYDRDVYFRDEPSGHGLLFDNFVAVMQIARQLAANALSNLVKAVVATFKKHPAANPFGESIARSIGTFYRGLEGEMDSRLDGRFGVQVISACEQIVAQAALSRSDRDTQRWTTQPPLQQPTVLVLGGTGFIGQYLVKALVRGGLGVRVVSRSLNAGHISLAGLPVELVQGDLADAAFMDTAMQGIEVIYDLAKAVGKKWDDYYQQDVLVTKNIAERALANGIKRFIYTGTIDSYYSADANAVITADTPLDSRIETRNHYARSKAACEALLMDFYRQKNLPVVIFRPGIVIGKGCPPAHWGVGMFQSETRMQFWGDGNHKLPLVLVEDVAEALALALDKPDIEGQTFLLTDEPLLSGREYVDAVAKASGTRLRAEPTPIWKFFVVDAMKEAAKHLIKHPNRKTPNYRDWASRSHRARYDSTKTRELLGWQPAGAREILIERGIVASVRESMK